MRLLAVDSLAPHAFNDPTSIPPYAILSHTWGEEEVTLEDLKQGRAAALHVYSKIRQTAKLAAADGLEYFWIDSCCIDKTSSAELSEAINSMFAWYQQAKRCYAFLEDVKIPRTKENQVDGGEHGSLEQEQLDVQLARSRWFTRGWTLQELLAPDEVHFYDGKWDPIGTRTSLSPCLSTITSIDRDVLCLPRSPYTTSRTTIKSLLTDKSIAQRMSWAAKRQTTRPEDMAYCLLGLFDINMPLIYGEGLEKAFFRLQAAILRDSTDQTLLAWSPEAVSSSWVGVLAAHPRDFASGKSLVTIPANQVAFELTNVGLKISMNVITKTDATYSGVLACHEEDDFSTVLAMPLLQDMSRPGGTGGRAGEVYLRNWNLPIEKVTRAEEQKGSWKTVFLPTKPPTYPLDAVPRHFILGTANVGMKISIEATPKERWNETTRTMQFRDTEIKSRRAALTLRMTNGQATISCGLAFGVIPDDGRCPYVRLYHGPPSGTKVHTWLEGLVKTGNKEPNLEDSLFYLDYVLKVEVQQCVIFGKEVFVLHLWLHSARGKR